jgi:hypothetical protein
MQDRGRSMEIGYGMDLRRVERDQMMKKRDKSIFETKCYKLAYASSLSRRRLTQMILGSLTF